MMVMQSTYHVKIAIEYPRDRHGMTIRCLNRVHFAKDSCDQVDFLTFVKAISSVV
jgi:hypothetical protein